MLENDANNSPSQNNDTNNSSGEYLKRAAQACAAGDDVLGMHLYLAAFEKAAQDSYSPNEAAINGLRQAWKLACEQKERSLAEYIFEKLEPFLSTDETALFAEQLQKLALDKLEEFGLSRENLEDMTEMISQDFFGMETLSQLIKGDAREPFGFMNKLASPEPSRGIIQKTDEIKVEKESKPQEKTDQNESLKAYTDRLSYSDIVGFDDAIDVMHRFGIGVSKDPEFDELIKTLNMRHGLDKMPANDTFLFRSVVREDANQFMMATLGEIDLPAIRMNIEENLQGLPVLCVMASDNSHPRINLAHNTFEGGGVLILEDIDMWGSPLSEAVHDMQDGMIYPQLSRGAREAINLIRSAVENPEVYVLASASGEQELDSFFVELLEPLSIVDIQQPNDAERFSLWNHIADKHPSLRGIDRRKLVEFSARMSRFDIYMAAREAVEDAYKYSLSTKKYQPVTPGSLYEKLAAYQPLESNEYQQLENAVIDRFRVALDSLEDLLKGTED